MKHQHGQDSNKSLKVFAASVLVSLLAAGQADAQNTGRSGRDNVRLQGQVPLGDQLNGRAFLGYRNGIELVGHNNILDRRNNGNLGWVDDCAYVSAYFGSAFAANSGLAVINAANPERPALTRIWPGTPGARESQVEGSEESRMVVVMPFPRATFFGDAAAPASYLEFYDVPQGNCGQLVKRGTFNFGNYQGQKVVTHEHRIWKEKVYVTSQSPGDPGPPLLVIDASNRDNPVEIASWDLADEGNGQPIVGIHDMDISPDGKRVYGNILMSSPSGGFDGGLVILDTSEVAAWKPGMPRPKIKRISEILIWQKPHPGNSHTAQYMEVQGRKYVVVANEGTGCPAPWTQIVDVNYEPRPVVISNIRLEVNRPENCQKTLPDHNGFTLGDSGGIDGLLLQYRYGAHYVGVDDVKDAKILAMTWYSAGLHLFDVSDPYSPKHVGEFIPPALNSSTYGLRRALPDRTYSFVRFHKGNIWFTSANGGFWIVRHDPKHYDPTHKADRIWH